MAIRMNIWTAWAAVSMSCCAAAGAVGFREAGGAHVAASCCAAAGAVGFREAGGAHVAAGTQTLSGAFMVSPQGEFVKTGAGTLEIVPVGLWIIFQ